MTEYPVLSVEESVLIDPIRSNYSSLKNALSDIENIFLRIDVRRLYIDHIYIGDIEPGPAVGTLCNVNVPPVCFHDLFDDR